ncbi:hypothetical protein J437_LFUL000819 [Ladona fulva]|uniref:Uncharacterized protein n=1 Tax=Ladona fulva TaxID=123851 RepID=A0A8K0KTU4_LADFU|nr:hypothetical protein J437_LFUL000819 [Ladona fulva]
MELIPSKQIVLQYLDDRSTSRIQTQDYQVNSIFTNHPPNKKFNPVKMKEEKSLLKSSLNVIYLNKYNIFNSEIALLQKYWYQWKSAVMINIASKMKPSKRKEITFDEMCKVSKATNPLKNEYDYIFKPDPFHSMKGIKFSSKKYTSDKPKTMCKDGNLLRESLEIQVYSGKIALNRFDQDILHYYWNIWKNRIRGRKIVSKIDSFLNIVTVEKNKTIDRCKQKILADSHKEKCVKTCEIRKRDSLDEALAATRHHKTSSKKGFSNHMLRSLSEKNISVSSLKDEVKTSLKRAHSILENTIEESLRDNHARRKNFNPLIRKRSPAPLEMADSDILERMKIREMERTERWEKLKERRRILEEEKKRRVLEEEKEVLRQKELLKNLKLEEQREKQQQEIEKQNKLEVLKQERLELSLKAVFHHRKRLLVMGMNVFRKAIILKTEFLLEADNYYQKKMMSRIFQEWKFHCYISKERQMSLAVCFHYKCLLRSHFSKWMKLHMELTLSKQAAVDFYEMRVQENVLLLWHRFTCDMIIEENMKLELAGILYRKHCRDFAQFISLRVRGPTILTAPLVVDTLNYLPFWLPLLEALLLEMAINSTIVTLCILGWTMFTLSMDRRATLAAFF